LLPQLDKERQTYGMKETVLAKMYVQIMDISPESEDARRLIHWRKPNLVPAPTTTITTTSIKSASTAGDEDSTAGDFGMALFRALRNRCPEKGDLSVWDVNDQLNQLNAAADRESKKKVLKTLLRRTTAKE